MIRRSRVGRSLSPPRAAVLLGCLIAASSASAQYRTVGTIIGRIADEHGSARAGVEISLRSDAATAKAATTTDGEGSYRITDLVPGTYTISFEAEDGVTAAPLSVTVNAGSVRRVDATIASTARFAGEVEVAGRAPAIETASATVSTYITRTEIERLPVQHRTFHDLLRTAPGFQLGTIAGTFRNAGPRDSFNVHGARANQNVYLLDGVPNNDRSDLNAEDVASVLALAGPRSTAGAGLAGATFQVGAALQTFNLDAVEEVQLQASPFSADIGDGSGGVVNVITRTGSDQLHGSLTVQSQTEDFLEGEPQQELDRRQLAAALGGPVVRGRAWYFATYERDDHDLGYDFGQSPHIVGPFLEGLGLTANATTRDRLTARLTGQVAPANRLTVTLNAIDERADVRNSIFRASVADLVLEEHANRSLGLVLRDFHVFPSGVELESIVGYTAADRDFESLVDGARRVRQEVGPDGLKITAIGTNSPDGRNELDRLVLSQQATFHTRSMAWKVGAELERFEQTTRQDEYTTLDYLYRSFDALPYRGSWIAATELAVDVTELAVFVQDDWFASSDWTVNLGLRFQRDDLVGQGVLEPRLGVAHDPGGDGRSVLRLGGGLYHDRTNLIGHTGALRPPTVPFTVDQSTGAHLYGLPDQYVVDPELELPRIAKWLVGYERQVGRGGQLAVTLYGAHSRDLFYTERTNRRDATGRRPDPSRGVVDVYTNTGSSDVYDLEIAWRQVFAGGSLVRASYTWEDATGNSAFDLWSGNHPLETYAASQESGPVALVEGPLDHAIEHAFKLSAVGRLPHGFLVSGFLDWHSGLPYTVRDNFFSPWFGSTFVDGYNSRTIDSYFNLDLRLGWQASLGRGHGLEIFLDAFNLTDETNVLDVDGVRRVNLFGNGLDPDDPSWSDNPRFLEPLFTGPRRSYQVGVRWSF